MLTETVNGEVINTMTYDNYGNIKSKNGVAYTYGDAVWKDLLTKVGNQTITYDAQGNPTTYLGHTLAWEKGRQLKSFDNIAYTYNANGIRTSKTVNGVNHIYTLDGTKILCETWGDNTIIPLYDNEDGVCGIVYNDEPFYFQKNLQGDIIGIMDKDARSVAKYSYDAWGVCTVVSDISDCAIATINPYRYRRYYYDPEIGMYYLQSRYYNPVVGRFVNGDSVEYLSADPYKIGNIFSYCNNACVCCLDDSGFDAGYITNQKAEPYDSMKLSRNVTVGQAGCGAVAVYNVMHSFSKKVDFKRMLPVVMNALPTVGMVPVFGPATGYIIELVKMVYQFSR